MDEDGWTWTWIGHRYFNTGFAVSETYPCAPPEVLCASCLLAPSNSSMTFWWEDIDAPLGSVQALPASNAFPPPLSAAGHVVPHPKLRSTNMKETIFGTGLLQVSKGKNPHIALGASSSPSQVLGFLPFASFHSCLSLEDREWFRSNIFFSELRKEKTVPKKNIS